MENYKVEFIVTFISGVLLTMFGLPLYYICFVILLLQFRHAWIAEKEKKESELNDKPKQSGKEHK